VLNDREREIILHAGRQDLEALQTRELDCNEEIYDTQVAASFLGYGDQVSYASLVSSICGVELSKTQTRTDWSRRPITAEQLQYAADDVLYLEALRDYLDRELESRGRLAWHRQECRKLYSDRNYALAPSEAWRRLKGGSGLPPACQCAAKALTAWRETRAQRRNRPREWILSSRHLLEIARLQPRSLPALAKIDGMPDGILRSAGKEIVKIVTEHPKESCESAVWKREQLLDSEQKGRVREIMAEIRQAAEREQLTPSLLASRAEVELQVSGDRNQPVLSDWRLEMVGNTIAKKYLD